MGFLILSMVVFMAVLQGQTALPTTGLDVTSSTVPPCPVNSHYGRVSGCDKTCDRLNNPKSFCAQYITSGCECNEGLIPQSGTSGTSVVCVKPENCKPKGSKYIP